MGDFFLLGALAAGESARVPTAALVHNGSVNWPLPGVPRPPPGAMPVRGPFGWLRDRAWATAYNHVARREGLRFVNEARASLGLAAIRRPHEQVERATRVLVMGSPAFQLPVRTPLPDNIRHVGAILLPPPEWPWEPPEDDGRPLVLVSLSTLPQGQGPIMRRVLASLRDLPVRAVVTLGPALSQETFDVPDNVRVETFVPHELVLPHASAVVTQCGLSTITKVLAAGVPMVCLPVLGDQPANAVCVTALGAGVRLAKDASVSTIADAVIQVLREPQFGHAARGFAATLATENPRQAIVGELETLVDRGAGFQGRLTAAAVDRRDIPPGDDAADDRDTGHDPEHEERSEHPRRDADRLGDLARDRDDHGLANQVGGAEGHSVDPPWWSPR